MRPVVTVVALYHRTSRSDVDSRAASPAAMPMSIVYTCQRDARRIDVAPTLSCLLGWSLCVCLPVLL